MQAQSLAELVKMVEKLKGSPLCMSEANVSSQVAGLAHRPQASHQAWVKQHIVRAAA
jgi:hypothetical protein